MWSTESGAELLHTHTVHSVDFTESSSSSSSVCWRTVEVQMESESSVETSSFEISAGPKLLKELSDIRVKSGDVAQFSCSFAGQPFTGVEWDHNGQSVALTQRVRNSQMGGLLSLVIQGVGVADQGVYCCTATNKHGYNSCSAQLTVEGGYSLLFIIWSIIKLSTTAPPAAPHNPPNPPLLFNYLICSNTLDCNNTLCSLLTNTSL